MKTIPPEDEIDDDGDGLVDALDTGCASASDNDEEESCNDSVDNDSDGWVDSDDPDCASIGDEVGFGSPHCNDGTDNDGDGAVRIDFDKRVKVGCRSHTAARGKSTFGIDADQ